MSKIYAPVNKVHVHGDLAIRHVKSCSELDLGIGNNQYSTQGTVTVKLTQKRLTVVKIRHRC